MEATTLQSKTMWLFELFRMNYLIKFSSVWLHVNFGPINIFVFRLLIISNVFGWAAEPQHRNKNVTTDRILPIGDDEDDGGGIIIIIIGHAFGHNWFSLHIILNLNLSERRHEWPKSCWWTNVPTHKYQIMQLITKLYFDLLLDCLTVHA